MNDELSDKMKTSKEIIEHKNYHGFLIYIWMKFDIRRIGYAYGFSIYNAQHQCICDWENCSMNPTHATFSTSFETVNFAINYINNLDNYLDTTNKNQQKFIE